MHYICTPLCTRIKPLWVNLASGQDTQMQLIYFNGKKLTFSHSFGETKKKKRSCPPCEDVKFIILQIMRRKTLLALIRVKLVFYLCLQVSYKGYKPAENSCILRLLHSYCSSIWKHLAILFHISFYDKLACSPFPLRNEQSAVLNKNHLYSLQCSLRIRLILWAEFTCPLYP